MKCRINIPNLRIIFHYVMKLLIIFMLVLFFPMIYGCVSYKVYQTTKHDIIENSLNNGYEYLDEELLVAKRKIAEENPNAYLIEININMIDIIKYDTASHCFAVIIDSAIGWTIKQYLDKNF